MNNHAARQGRRAAAQSAPAPAPPSATNNNLASIEMYAHVSAALTPDAIHRMYQLDSSTDDEFFLPVVQVLRLQKLEDSSGNGGKWVVVLSDGRHFLYGECSPGLTRMVHDHVIAQNAILRVRQFTMSTRGDRRVCQLLDVQQVTPNPGIFLGSSPTDVRLRDATTRRDGLESSAAAEEAAVHRRLSDLTLSHPSGTENFFAMASRPKWQNSYRDVLYRRSMIKEIERELVEAERTQQPILSAERLIELSTLAIRWEFTLYQKASSCREYLDASTFKVRLAKLSRSADSLGEITSQQHYRLHLLRHAISCKEAVCSVTPLCRDMKDVWHHLDGCYEEKCQVPFCFTLKRLMYHSKTCMRMGCQVCEPTIQLDGCLLCEHRGNNRQVGLFGDSSHGSKLPDKMISLRQEYLLTLLHASTCPHDEDGQCLLSPLCFDLKKALMHKTFCSAIGCKFPFCASTRVIMDHYNACKSQTCQLCPPVRSTRVKHGINKLTVDPEAPPSEGEVAEAQAVPSPVSSGPEVVASQVAIYEVIQQRNKRRLSGSYQGTAQADAVGYGGDVDSMDSNDPMEDAGGGSSTGGNSVDKSCKLSIEQLQICEYERIRNAHQLRLKERVSSSPEPGGTDKKLPAAVVVPAHAYYGTAYSTRNNTKPVVCGHCSENIFIPSVALAYSCQACNQTSLSSKKASSAHTSSSKIDP